MLHRLVLLCGCLLSVAGCQSLTVLSNDKRSPSKQYGATITLYGAPGKSFVDRTEKIVVIEVNEWLKEPERPPLRPAIPELKTDVVRPIDSKRVRTLYHKRLILQATDLTSTLEWSGDTNVIIRLFERDPHAATPDALKASLRPLAPPSPSQLSLCLNPVPHTFEECSSKGDGGCP